MRGIRVGMIRMRGIRVGDDGNVWNQGGDAGNQGGSAGNRRGNAEIRVRIFV